MASSRRDLFKKWLETRMKELKEVGMKLYERSVEEKEKNPKVATALETASLNIQMALVLLEKLYEAVVG